MFVTICDDEIVGIASNLAIAREQAESYIKKTIKSINGFGSKLKDYEIKETKEVGIDFMRIELTYFDKRFINCSSGSYTFIIEKLEVDKDYYDL